MPTQTGSLDLKSGNDAAKTATNYITEISTTDGIKVHNANDTSNYAQINSSGMNVVQSGVSVASFGTSARVGKESGGHTIVDSDGMRVYRDGTEANILANIGYGNGKSSTGTTVKAPFYTLGQRVSDSVIGNYSMAEGVSTTANGYASHAQNHGTIAAGYGQTAIGRYNIEDNSTAWIGAKAFIIGNGSSTTRSNAFYVTWDGAIGFDLRSNIGVQVDHDIYANLVLLGWDSEVLE